MQTYIGTVVVSVNPYRQLPLFTGELMEEYRMRNIYEMPPHMYVWVVNVKNIYKMPPHMYVWVVNVRNIYEMPPHMYVWVVDIRLFQCKTFSCTSVWHLCLWDAPSHVRGMFNI